MATANAAKFVVKSNGKVGICITDPQFNLDISGTGRINGLTITSDERLKENILPIENVSANLLKLKAVNYNFKYSTEDLHFMINGDRYDKDSVKVEKNKLDATFYSKKRIGFLAQDVKSTFPNLVYEDSLGILSLDYIGFIPLIVEAQKEQQNMISEQENKIKELETRITDLEKLLNNTAKKSKTGTIDNLNSDDISALSQNVPNPFDQQTEIAYYLTESTLNAMINIYNMNGNPIKSINLTETGQGVITIKGSELQAGMYLYSLIADGVEIDTKRMILTD